MSAILNFAVKYYGLKENVARKAGAMGKKESDREMLIWTKDEYMRFAEVKMDEPMHYYAFELLYWCGIREGELLALTPSDFDFNKRTLRINKSYQRINGCDIITEPKTPKSNRIIKMPSFLCDEMQDYIGMLYGAEKDTRLFPISKTALYRSMKTGCEKAEVKKIRIHDLRHSHVSLLIDLGFSAVEIADRMGHESVDMTYHYAHMFPSRQDEMANKLENERGNLKMSAKNRDEHNRWRNKTVAFRMSPEESNELDMKVKLSGLTKQDYLINRALQRDIVVVSNPKVYVALKKKLEEVLNELKSLNSFQPSAELLETIKLISKTLYEMKGDKDE